MSGGDGGGRSARVVQLTDGAIRRVGLVEEPSLHLLATATSVYALAIRAAESGVPLADLIAKDVSPERLPYDAVYDGASAWRLLPPIDHPGDPARCLISGTGLTHLGSARDRDAMHDTGDAPMTDSMRMFRLGLDGGKPPRGTIGAAPEWFHKGTGLSLRAHREPLVVPAYAEDGGEEAEIAGVYVIDASGRPCRLGMTAGNEFSDHAYERRNYLHLAASKLRTCALGPELVLNPAFDSVAGEVWIDRAGGRLWGKVIATGEAGMCHSLENIEHHHFKFEAHRRPGDVHVHFFGAHSLSCGDGVVLEDGDEMAVRFEGFGRALRNPVRIDRAPAPLVRARPL
jgi:hypothetical protein